MILKVLIHRLQFIYVSIFLTSSMYTLYVTQGKIRTAMVFPVTRTYSFMYTQHKILCLLFLSFFVFSIRNFTSLYAYLHLENFQDRPWIFEFFFHLKHIHRRERSSSACVIQTNSIRNWIRWKNLFYQNTFKYFILHVQTFEAMSFLNKEIF